MTDADGPEVIEIFAQSIQEGGATFRASAPSFEAWSAGHLPNLRYVAKRQGEVLGFIAAAPTSQMEAYWGMIEISLYIRGNARGPGDRAGADGADEARKRASGILVPLFLYLR